MVVGQFGESMGVENYLLKGSCTVVDALRHMDQCAIKYAFAVDENLRVVGTLTDGDIRRGILKGVDLSNPISDIANKSFCSISCEDHFDRILEIFRQFDIEFIPILNKDGTLKNIVSRHILNVLLLTNNRLDAEFDFDSLNCKKIEHEIFVRPWGYYKTMVLNKMFQSKMIYVLPNQSLSLQSHMYREEYWTIISGRGTVLLDDVQYCAKPGCFYHIPVGAKHRIINDSDADVLVFSEVQLGEYFGEDDIVRYDDNYGRL